MKKHLNLMFGLALAATFTACKKDQIAQDEGPGKLKDRVDLKMNLPGQSNQEVYLVEQPNGTFQGAWWGTMVFGSMPHPIVNVKNGQPIPAVEVLDPNTEYLQVLTAGPYFTVIRPTFVGDPLIMYSEFQNFKKAYDNYIGHKKDEYGTLLQPSLPNMDSFMSSGSNNGEIVVKGMVVSSTSSPSKMSIVSHTFQPPKPASEMYLLFPDYIVGNVLYTITGNNQGGVQEVTAEDLTTHVNIPLFGFSGTYTEITTGVHVQDLKIWTSPTTYITYTGNLQ